MTGTLLVIALVSLLMLTTVGANRSHSSLDGDLSGLEFDQPSGTHMVDVINLSGFAEFPLRNASWSIVNISSLTPTTVLSGPYLTAVHPLADNEYQWELLVDVPHLDCTCYIEIDLVEVDGIQHQWRHLVYVGDHHHRPVFSDERTLTGSTMEQSIEQDNSQPILLDGSLDLSFDVMLPPSSTSLTQVLADVCEAPNGVCREASRTLSVPFAHIGSEVTVTVDPMYLNLSQGIWLIEFTATDDLLRNSGILQTTFLYDNQAPTVELLISPTVMERESVNVYISVEDGYLGQSTSFTWTIIDENGMRRAPLISEQISMDQLQLNFSEQGAYSIEVSVRDRAGYVTQDSSTLTVINQRPTALISVDGLVLTDDVRLNLVDGESWLILGNKSLDNEPVDYLWVINDDRSYRGLSSLTPEQFDQTGVHKIELIVFDDDGATHSTTIEIDILASEQEESSSVLAWFFPGLLVLLALLVIGFRSKASTNLELPKWKNVGGSDNGIKLNEYTNEDATIEEDEARG